MRRGLWAVFYGQLVCSSRRHAFPNALAVTIRSHRQFELLENNGQRQIVRNRSRDTWLRSLVRTSARGGQPTGTTALATDFRIKDTPSPRRNNLDIVAGFRKDIAMQKRKRGLRRVV